MIANSSRHRQLVAELTQVIVQIATMSHQPAQAFNPAPPEKPKPERWRVRNQHQPIPHLGAHHHRGGSSRLPGRDMIAVDDRVDGYRQKSDRYFIDKFRSYESNPDTTVQDLEELLEEAKACLKDWRCRPLVDGNKPARADPEWKRFIANSTEPSAQLAKEHRVSRQYIDRIRAGDWSAPDENVEEERARLRAEWERRRVIPEKARA